MNIRSDNKKHSFLHQFLEWIRSKLLIGLFGITLIVCIFAVRENMCDLPTEPALTFFDTGIAVLKNIANGVYVVMLNTLSLTHLRRFFMKSGQFLPTARSKINKIF